METIKTQDGSANYIGTTLRLAAENLRQAFTITVEYTYVGSSVTFGAVNGTITSAQVGGNGIQSGATLNPGATLNLTAQGNPGYEIQHWTVNGVEQPDSASDTFTYTAPENGTIGAVINAVYQQVEYNVSWTAGSHGTVSADGYTGDSEKCDMLREISADRFSAYETRVTSVGCAIGTHAGPGACVLGFISEK